MLLCDFVMRIQYSRCMPRGTVKRELRCDRTQLIGKQQVGVVQVLIFRSRVIPIGFPVNNVETCRDNLILCYIRFFQSEKTVIITAFTWITNDYVVNVYELYFYTHRYLLIQLRTVDFVVKQNFCLMTYFNFYYDKVNYTWLK